MVKGYTAWADESYRTMQCVYTADHREYLKVCKYYNYGYLMMQMFQRASDRLVVNKSRQTYSDHLFIVASINPKTPSSPKQVCFLAHQVSKDLNSSVNSIYD